MRLPLLLVFLCLLAAPARAQQSLGKHPADKVQANFYTQNTNAETTARGLSNSVVPIEAPPVGLRLGGELRTTWPAGGSPTLSGDATVLWPPAGNLTNAALYAGALFDPFPIYDTNGTARYNGFGGWYGWFNGIFLGSGLGVTNVVGTNIVAGTINSNKFDAPTLALLGAGGSGSTNAIGSNAGNGTNTTDWATLTVKSNVVAQYGGFIGSAAMLTNAATDKHRFLKVSSLSAETGTPLVQLKTSPDFYEWTTLSQFMGASNSQVFNPTMTKYSNTWIIVHGRYDYSTNADKQLQVLYSTNLVNWSEKVITNTVADGNVNGNAFYEEGGTNFLFFSVSSPHGTANFSNYVMHLTAAASPTFSTPVYLTNIDLQVFCAKKFGTNYFLYGRGTFLFDGEEIGTGNSIYTNSTGVYGRWYRARTNSIFGYPEQLPGDADYAITSAIFDERRQLYVSAASPANGNGLAQSGVSTNALDWFPAGVLNEDAPPSSWSTVMEIPPDERLNVGFIDTNTITDLGSISYLLHTTNATYTGVLYTPFRENMKENYRVKYEVTYSGYIAGDGQEMARFELDFFGGFTNYLSSSLISRRDANITAAIEVIWATNAFSTAVTPTQNGEARGTRLRLQANTSPAMIGYWMVREVWQQSLAGTNRNGYPTTTLSVGAIAADGSSLTALNASSLASGLIHPSRFTLTNGATEGWVYTWDNGTNKLVAPSSSGGGGGLSNSIPVLLAMADTTNYNWNVSESTVATIFLNTNAILNLTTNSTIGFAHGEERKLYVQRIGTTMFQLYNTNANVVFGEVTTGYDIGSRTNSGAVIRWFWNSYSNRFYPVGNNFGFPYP